MVAVSAAALVAVTGASTTVGRPGAESVTRGGGETRKSAPLTLSVPSEVRLGAVAIPNEAMVGAGTTMMESVSDALRPSGLVTVSEYEPGKSSRAGKLSRVGKRSAR